MKGGWDAGVENKQSSHMSVLLHGVHNIGSSKIINLIDYVYIISRNRINMMNLIMDLTTSCLSCSDSLPYMSTLVKRTVFKLQFLTVVGPLEDIERNICQQGKVYNNLLLSILVEVKSQCCWHLRFCLLLS